MTKQYIPMQNFVCKCFLIGVGLAGLALVVPDAGHGPGSFLNIAWQSSWQSLFEVQAAWCSLKIILLALGMFLVFNAIGFIFMNCQRITLSLIVLSIQAVFACGIAAGFFFFLRALL